MVRYRVGALIFSFLCYAQEDQRKVPGRIPEPMTSVFYGARWPELEQEVQRARLLDTSKRLYDNYVRIRQEKLRRSNVLQEDLSGLVVYED